MPKKKLTPGAQLAAMRINPGRKKLLRPCPHCQKMFGGRELAVHELPCRKRMLRKKAA
jgi:hypothetical protein